MQCAYKQDQDAKIDYVLLQKFLCLPPNKFLPQKNGAFFAVEKNLFCQQWNIFVDLYDNKLNIIADTLGYFTRHRLES